MWSKRERFDRVELIVLAAFAVTSVWVLLLGLWWTVTQGRIWTGVDGVYVQDVTQYLAWIRDASRHVLVSDLFVSRQTPHDYLQPAIAISGGLVAIGVAPWLALLLWQPVAVGGTFFAVRSLVHRQLAARFDRRAALVLALFGGSIGTFQDLWLPWWTWGYVFGVLSLAAMVASLLLYERAVRGAAPAWPAALLAGLAGWLHPWQGAVLALIIAGGEIVVSTQLSGSPGGPRRRSIARPASVLVSVSLPLAYYAAARSHRRRLAAGRGVAQRSGRSVAGGADARAAAGAGPPRLPDQAEVVHRRRRTNLAAGRVCGVLRRPARGRRRADARLPRNQRPARDPRRRGRRHARLAAAHSLGERWRCSRW